MRNFLVIMPAALLACSTPMASNEPLDGVWTLVSSAQSPLDPRTLTLAQHGATISGSGSAMGVDAALRVAIAGSNIGPRVALKFIFANGGSVTGEYTAMLGSDGRLSGVAVFHGSFAASHALTYTRK